MNNDTETSAIAELNALVDTTEVIETVPSKQDAPLTETDVENEAENFNADVKALYRDAVEGMTEDAMEVLKDFNSSVAEIEGNINLRMQQVLEEIAKLHEATAPDAKEFEIPLEKQQELARLQNSLNNLNLLKSQDNLRVFAATNPIPTVVATNINMLRSELKKLSHRTRQFRIPMTDFEPTFKIIESIGTGNKSVKEHLLLMSYFFRYLNSLKKNLPSMALYMRMSSTLFCMAIAMNRRLVIAGDLQQIHATATRL